jgi:tRNA A37 threonylcarbamoyladenosine modification protein TsaB
VALSYFLRGNEFHVATGGFSNIYRVLENRAMADNVASFINDALAKSSNEPIKTVIFQSGPASFTSRRIINSVAKGLAIFDKNIDFIGISSFLTYFSIASKVATQGIICIPTMRGDYFACEYDSKTIKKSKILDVASIAKCSISVYFEENLIFGGGNLAEIQKMASDLMLAKSDSILIDNCHVRRGILNIDYGYTPEYDC